MRPTNGYFIDTSYQRNVIFKQLSFPNIESEKPFLTLLGECGGFIAGGAIASLFTQRPINDWDLFFRDLQGKNKFEKYLNDFFTKKFESPRASTFSTLKIKYGKTWVGPNETNKGTIDIQCVHTNFGSPQDILQTFDFTCCQGAFDPVEGEFILGKFFMSDNISKSLVYTENVNPLDSFFRLFKYTSYGYKINFSQMLKIIIHFRTLNLGTFGNFLNVNIKDRQIPVFKLFQTNIEKYNLQDKPFDASLLLEWIDEFSTSHSESSELGFLRF